MPDDAHLAPSLRELADLRALTPARVALPRSGVSLSTSAMLAFARDHAAARDAVHTAFDVEGVKAQLSALGLDVRQVCSQARSRADYLRRPDLGRRLAPESCDALTPHPCDVAVVVGDGLSAAAVHAHVSSLLRDLLPRLKGLMIGPVVVASGARVALGDDIGARLGARLVLMLIGERPGLTTPDSLGAYLTHAPRIGLTDADRNCVSNIHQAGLSYPHAAGRIAWLAHAALARAITGVALKDDSALALAGTLSQHLVLPVK